MCARITPQLNYDTTFSDVGVAATTEYRSSLNKRLLAPVLQEYSVVSISRCSAHCQVTPSCKAFDYSRKIQKPDINCHIVFGSSEVFFLVDDSYWEFWEMKNILFEA